MKPTVIFQNVTKQYKMYATSSDRLKAAVSPNKYGEDFFALQNVSFTAEEGDVIGVVGINGAGKSTLSNIIAGVTPQTSGEVKVIGTVSVIAIASGLDNELTGRDNIRYKCLMLGFKRKQIEEMMPDIIAFSDIGNFIDQPVKNYSSGMKSRLGFAISVNVDPDVLIIDEALSVGDQTFKERCYQKMNEFKEQGKTIFFVSHALGQIKRFCTKVLWLEAGILQGYGPRIKILPQYREFLRNFKSKSEEEKQAFREDIQNRRRTLQEDVQPIGTEVQAVIPQGNNSRETRTKRYRKRRLLSFRTLIPILSIIFLALVGMTLYKIYQSTESEGAPEIAKSAMKAPINEMSRPSVSEKNIQYMNENAGNIRPEPDMDVDASGYAYFGEAYVVEDNESETANDASWLKVKELTGDKEGWVSASLMEALDGEQEDAPLIENIRDLIGDAPELDALLQQLSAEADSSNQVDDKVDIQLYSGISKETLIDRIGDPSLESEQALLYHGETYDYIFQMTDNIINQLQVTTNEISDES